LSFQRLQLLNFLENCHSYCPKKVQRRSPYGPHSGPQNSVLEPNPYKRPPRKPAWPLVYGCLYRYLYRFKSCMPDQIQKTGRLAGFFMPVPYPLRHLIKTNVIGSPQSTDPSSTAVYSGHCYPNPPSNRWHETVPVCHRTRLPSRRRQIVLSSATCDLPRY